MQARAGSRRSADAVTLDLVAVTPRTSRRSVDAPTLVMPLIDAVVDLTVGGWQATIDPTTCAVIPAGSAVALRSSTMAPPPRVALVGLRAPLLAAVEAEYTKLGVDQRRFTRWLAAPDLLPRTTWVYEIVHRYVFERDNLGQHGNLATRFLEIEIGKEIFFLFRDRRDGADRAAAESKHSRPVASALAWIEAHVFDPMDIVALAAQAGASESTLLRAFHRELGCTPAAHWRARKLDEALVLLRAHRYSVTEVATEVGYSNSTSFTFAFRRRFGKPPSDFFQSRRLRRAP